MCRQVATTSQGTNNPSETSPQCRKPQRSTSWLFILFLRLRSIESESLQETRKENLKAAMKR